MHGVAHWLDSGFLTRRSWVRVPDRPYLFWLSKELFVKRIGLAGNRTRVTGVTDQCSDS